MPNEVPVRSDDGVSLHTEEHGAAADEAELTVVLLHGWTLDSRMWGAQVDSLPLRLAEALPGTPSRVLTYDARGHGRSDHLKLHTATLAHLADDLAAVISARVPNGRVVLVGHSLGGMTVLEYAHRHTDEFAERVAGVALVNSTAEGELHTSYGVGRRTAALIRALEVTSAGVLARAGSWRPHRVLHQPLRPGLRWLLFGDRVDDEVLALTASMVTTAPLRSIGGFRPAVGAHRRTDVLERMSEVPVTVMVGSHDRLTPHRCVDTIVDALPDAEALVVDGAGHMLPLERPAETVEAIVELVVRAANRPDVPVADDDPPVPLTGEEPPRQRDGRSVRGPRPAHGASDAAAA